LGITFVHGHQLGKKLYSDEAIQFFYLQKENKKIRAKNCDHRYLPKIPFVPYRDNGPLGVKDSSITLDE